MFELFCCSADVGSVAPEDGANFRCDAARFIQPSSVLRDATSRRRLKSQQRTSRCGMCMLFSFLQLYLSHCSYFRCGGLANLCLSSGLCVGTSVLVDDYATCKLIDGAISALQLFGRQTLAAERHWPF